MRIIVLEGLPNKGKTATLNILHKLLLQNGGVSTNKSPLGGDPNDFSDIVTNYKSLKIAFYTMGDFSNYISKAIQDYDSQKCDIFICALSTTPYKVNANKRINRYQNIRVPKTISNTVNQHRLDNSNDASYLFSLI